MLNRVNSLKEMFLCKSCSNMYDEIQSHGLTMALGGVKPHLNEKNTRDFVGNGCNRS